MGKTETEQMAVNVMDAIVKQSGDNIMVATWKENQGFAKSKVKIINPEGWARDKITNDNGKTQLKSNMKGYYLVELEYIDKNPGSFKGKEYQTVRYRCETTIKVQ